MTEQFELFDKGTAVIEKEEKDRKTKIENNKEGKEIAPNTWERKYGISEGETQFKTFVRKTEKEYTCADCGRVIPEGSSAVKFFKKLTTFEEVKGKTRRVERPDFENPEYFHPKVNGECPEPN